MWWWCLFWCTHVMLFDSRMMMIGLVVVVVGIGRIVVVVDIFLCL